jgi:hypothetical protein
MDAESFTELALRVIAREATADERRAFEAQLAAVPARREEFRQLEIVHDILRTAAPMSEAVRAQQPELPAYRMNELRTAVRQHFGPAANREKIAAMPPRFIPVLRWLFVGSGAAVLAVAVVLLSQVNRSVEIGLYSSDLVRSGDTALSQKDVPSAQLITFDEDAPFDHWQSQPLAWYEHAKIWVDHERDLLHIVRRQKHGQVVIETQPLAPTDEGQRQQIQRVVDSLKD